MNDLNRATLDAEIEHIHDLMAKADPASEEYQKYVKNVEVLMKAANEDDKIHLAAKTGELRFENESEQIKQDSKWKKIGSIAGVVGTVITSVTTVACYLILVVSNGRRQVRSISFEKDGFAHTDRSDKFVQKEQFPRL